MDESHRLSEMVKDYDPKLFTQLHQEVKPLIKKLTYGIDHRRYGVEREDIESAFNIKFIFTFNRYYNTEKQYLKAYLIRSLQMYSCRLMRQSYQDKFVKHLEEVDVNDLYDESLIIVDEPSDTEHEDKLSRVLRFLKTNVCDNALLIFQLELNPPPYIQRELENMGKPINAKIPNDLIAEFLGLEGDNAIEYIRDLRKSTIDLLIKSRAELC